MSCQPLLGRQGLHAYSRLRGMFVAQQCCMCPAFDANAATSPGQLASLYENQHLAWSKASFCSGLTCLSKPGRAAGHSAGVDVVTLGQYMRPTKRHMPVVEFVTPEAFQGYETSAKNMGFLYAAAGPMVRSSYRAGEFYLSNVLRSTSQDEAAAG